MSPEERPQIYVVDDDVDLAGSVVRFLGRADLHAKQFSDPATLLEAYPSNPAGCVITDVMMGDMDGFAFAERLRAVDRAVALIFMTAWPQTSAAVDAVRSHGGIDYLEKPLNEERLLASVIEGLNWSQGRRAAEMRLTNLTSREREVFSLLVKGFSSKAIAARLEISPRTVDDHRANIAIKTGASTIAELIQLASGTLP